MNRCVRSYSFGPTLLMVILVVVGCSSPESATTSSQSAEATWSEAAVALTAVNIHGDELEAVVRYSGGCGEHKLSLETHGPMLKSLPPKQPLRVLHLSSGDPCRATIFDTLVVPLASFRGTPRGTTVLLLEGWNEDLLYSYPKP